MDINDGYIKVNDRYKFYIDIDQKQDRYLLFNANIPLKEGLDQSTILEFVNKVNSEVIAVQCYYNAAKNRIYIFHYWWIDGGGFTQKTFIKILRFFNSILSATYSKNPEESLW